jgi:hypothetical protein
MAISDVLFTAVEQIRAELRQADAVGRPPQNTGNAVQQDSGLRADVYAVADQMERLARRLLTDAVGPVSAVQ